MSNSSGACPHCKAGWGNLHEDRCPELRGKRLPDRMDKFWGGCILTSDDIPETTQAFVDRTIAADLPDDNPKTKFGVAKPPLRLVPGAALALVAMAFKDGAAKYGPANWREKPVSSTTYIDAAERHIRQWFDGGEENAEDSGCHHLAHAAACLMILLDAEVAGKLNDNRPPSVDLSALFKKLTAK